MDNLRIMIYMIEYGKTSFEETHDDYYELIPYDIHKEYFDDEIEFNKRISELERSNDYEILSRYSGEIYRMTR